MHRSMSHGGERARDSDSFPFPFKSVNISTILTFQLKRMYIWRNLNFEMFFDFPTHVSNILLLNDGSGHKLQLYCAV